MDFLIRNASPPTPKKFPSHPRHGSKLHTPKSQLFCHTYVRSTQSKSDDQLAQAPSCLCGSVRSAVSTPRFGGTPKCFYYTLINERLAMQDFVYEFNEFQFKRIEEPIKWSPNTRKRV